MTVGTIACPDRRQFTSFVFVSTVRLSFPANYLGKVPQDCEKTHTATRFVIGMSREIFHVLSAHSLLNHSRGEREGVAVITRFH